MKLDVEKEFRDICTQIIQEGKSIVEWAEIESSDMFQSKSFSGGYDADEEAFCFSYYDLNQDEYWFQLTLEEIMEVENGKKKAIEISLASP